MRDKTLHVDLGIDATNDDIVEQMRIMKCAREERFYQHVVCTIRGFSSDQRELYEIPEVRGFCRRLVTLGFTSYLDFSTTLPTTPPGNHLAWGAMEVWLCSEKLMRRDGFLSKKSFERFVSELDVANEKADSLLGPMQ